MSAGERTAVPPKAATAAAPVSPLVALAPGLFVVLWSTGFIGAKLGLPYAEPMTFLALRFGLVAVLMAAIALATGARWPRRPVEVLHSAVVGALLQGVYLGGVFLGIAHGISAGLSALIVGLQPLLTGVVVGLFLGEHVRPKQWAGLVLGLVGTVLVCWTKLRFDSEHLIGLATTILALFGITAGTLYQKRFCHGVDLKSATVIQNFTSSGLTFLAALLLEHLRVEWHPEFVFALGWLIVVLSLGANLLLLWLIRRGAAARTASLFYLVPPCTAFVAFLLFGESFGPLALAGLAVAAVGVALVNRG